MINNIIFGFKNFSFDKKASKISVEFSIGIIKKVTCKITYFPTADARKITEDINLWLILKNTFIKSTSILVILKIR